MPYNKKYYLHWKVRKDGYKLDTGHKTIDVKDSQAAMAASNKGILKLRDTYGYAVQYINPLIS